MGEIRATFIFYTTAHVLLHAKSSDNHGRGCFLAQGEEKKKKKVVCIFDSDSKWQTELNFYLKSAI